MTKKLKQKKTEKNEKQGTKVNRTENIRGQKNYFRNQKGKFGKQLKKQK